MPRAIIGRSCHLCLHQYLSIASVDAIRMGCEQKEGYLFGLCWFSISSIICLIFGLDLLWVWMAGGDAMRVVERDDYIHGVKGETKGGGEVFGSSAMACVQMVYAKLRLVPLSLNDVDYSRDVLGPETQDKPASFARTLTQWVFCSKIGVLKDTRNRTLHGIYVCKVASGVTELVIMCANPTGGNCHMPYGGFSPFLKEDDNKILRNGNSNGLNPSVSMMGRGKVRPEFCVKAPQVEAALQTRWSSGIRFKMT
ncbi:unnamed protein product [Sphenostylis stenocarpa]|uniref:Uncharacterized protein n=1 Tax=Sphenostylis stenocarpa TaxID=92480 RepID=A0AA86TIU7_9FABA|nr:unnamed protein product [Sphenostylis stenocarpa]